MPGVSHVNVCMSEVLAELLWVRSRCSMAKQVSAALRGKILLSSPIDFQPCVARVSSLQFYCVTCFAFFFGVAFTICCILGWLLSVD